MRLNFQKAIETGLHSSRESNFAQEEWITPQREINKTGDEMLGMKKLVRRRPRMKDGITQVINDTRNSRTVKTRPMLVQNHKK